MSVGLSDWLPWSCHTDCLSHEQTNVARFIWHMIAQWQPLHQYCVTAHENGSANRPVGRYKLIGDHDETCLSLVRKDLKMLAKRVNVWWFILCMSDGMNVAHFKVGHEGFGKFEVRCMQEAWSWIGGSPGSWLRMWMVQTKYWSGGRLWDKV